MPSIFFVVLSLLHNCQLRQQSQLWTALFPTDCWTGKQGAFSPADNLAWEELADVDASLQAGTDDDDIPELDSVAESGYQVSRCMLYNTMAVVCVMLFMSVCSTCLCAFILLLSSFVPVTLRSNACKYMTYMGSCKRVLTHGHVKDAFGGFCCLTMYAS